MINVNRKENVKKRRGEREWRKRKKKCSSHDMKQWTSYSDIGYLYIHVAAAVAHNSTKKNFYEKKK